ncbi:unnamed protein product [Adineta steineri]|uniref:Uncharacterized protein n=1 Tax=Adineta steineri TaxID=433720 RepID=A0A814CW26_9BILA|nr:unnamed protein product [Adineta steineri]CAF0854275.1 unnamed protein product [Adineta steineri]CAF0946118.1 unnamed protein product [Adineta steineri]
MYLPLLIDKQLNLTFKTQLLDTNEGISGDLCHKLHTATTDCFPLKSIELHKRTASMTIDSDNDDAIYSALWLPT